MKLPKDLLLVVGRNKRRDYTILSEVKTLLDSDDFKGTFHDACLEISKRFNFTQERIRQIVRSNHVLIEIDKNWERKKDIWRVDKEIKNKPKSEKDMADLIALKHELIDGKKPLIDASTHNHFVSIKHFIEGQVKTNRIPDAVNR